MWLEVRTQGAVSRSYLCAAWFVMQIWYFGIFCRHCGPFCFLSSVLNLLSRFSGSDYHSAEVQYVWGNAPALKTFSANDKQIISAFGTYVRCCSYRSLSLLAR